PAQRPSPTRQTRLSQRPRAWERLCACACCLVLLVEADLQVRYPAYCSNVGRFFPSGPATVLICRTGLPFFCWLPEIVTWSPGFNVCLVQPARCSLLGAVSHPDHFVVV